MTRAVPPCSCLRAHKDLAVFVESGIQALRPIHRRLVETPEVYECSLDLDKARKRAEPNATRWDYALATNRLFVAMEIHPAKASEVNVMIRKKQWAESLLPSAIRVARWNWIVPHRSRIHFTLLSPEARRLALFHSS